MLDITPQHIAELNDTDLRILIGLLCEATLRRLGLPTAAVTYGGDQNAADDGLDVRIALSGAISIEGFIPRPCTGFQVKRTSMPVGRIRDEMRPKGVLRPVIQELARQSGAYIIVSSHSSTSDRALRSRRKAMMDSVKELPHDSLTLDFYDQARIATWVRDYPGLIPWIRLKIGKPLQGWQPYGAWATPSEDTLAEYLVDDKATRVRTSRKEDGEGLHLVEGIGRIRDTLRESRQSVRLVGLSGVGKTRLVQALFDSRIGTQALDPSLAFYTNLADDPNPQPIAFASYLIAARMPAVLVVDNCPRDLHRRLSELCRSAESAVNLITIEYDIRDDEPEGTEVFRLEPSSVELVEKLIRHRFEVVSPIDARTVAEFSGGNARVAIALASTIGKGDTIAGLRDEELFERLFQQRHEHDAELLLAAQACSLVYSFHGESISGDEAELLRLGALIGKSAEEMFRRVAELRRRDLVQQRGAWRAVLPHAIANRLAGMALQNFPTASIVAQLVEGATERLAKSFSRRLGYLHDRREAVQIIKGWLADGGLLGQVERLNSLGVAMFNNVAPAAPAAALEALGRAIAKADPCEIISIRREHVRLLRSMAYDPELFDESVRLLAELAETERDRDQQNGATNALTSLFYMYLSGTQAPVEQRLKLVRVLVRSEDVERRALGLKVLGASLEAGHFSSGYGFEFGGRSRDHGYWPRTKAEVRRWFSSVLALVEELAISDLPCASKVAGCLAGKFRGLWTAAEMGDDLARVARAISSRGRWREGWIAVRETLRLDSEKLNGQALANLTALEKDLRPTDLVSKVRFIVLSDRSYALGLSDVEPRKHNEPLADLERADELARALGKEVARDTLVLETLVPELLRGTGRHFSFGQGLALGGENRSAVWQLLTLEVLKTPPDEANIGVLCGFLNALRDVDASLCGALLDNAVEDAGLAYWFPVLQIASGVDARGVTRLKRSLVFGKAPAGMFAHLAYGRSSDPIVGSDLRGLVLSIADRPDGFDVASLILQMRLHSDREQKHEADSELIQAGRELLRRCSFDERYEDRDYKLSEIAAVCLTGEDGASIAQALCRKLRQAISRYKVSVFGTSFLVRTLLKVQPTAVLDALLLDDDRRLTSALDDGFENDRVSPVDGIEESALFNWCERDPASRYPKVAAVVTIFKRPDENGALQWTKVAQQILERAPDRIAIVRQFMRRFSPSSWSGSRAAIMEERARLLGQLASHRDPLVADFVATEQPRLTLDIARQRELERSEDKERDERFE